MSKMITFFIYDNSITILVLYTYNNLTISLYRDILITVDERNYINASIVKILRDYYKNVFFRERTQSTTRSYNVQ